MQFVTAILIAPILAATTFSSAQAQDALEAEQRAFIERFQSATRPARSSSAERAAAADFLMDELTRRGFEGERRPYLAPNVTPVLDLVMPPFRGTNITATIPATLADAPVIVLGGHYDTEAGSPGADDNASGIAAVLTVAEAIAALDQRPYAVLVAFFDQEEEGKVGSAALARQLTREGANIHSMHSIDMTGWDSDGDGAIEIDAPDSWYPRYRDAADQMGIPITRVVFDSSDHVSFRDLGIDAVCIGEAFRAGDYSPHRHRPSDTADTLNHAYLARNTRLLQAVLTGLMAEEVQ